MVSVITIAKDAGCRIRIHTKGSEFSAQVYLRANTGMWCAGQQEARMQRTQ
jgi:hypothetical protein